MSKRATGAMHVARVRKIIKGKAYESALLRQSYRDGAKVKHRTLASLTALPSHVVDAIDRMLRGESLIPASEALAIERSWPHGHVAAVLGTAGKLGMPELLDSRPSRERDLALAMIVARVLQPASKLATTRLWTSTSLARTMGVEDATEDELYGAMDWLVERQEGIESKLAQQHLKPGDLALYDLSSVYLEGSHCPLARRGYSRDGMPGTLQIEFGMVTSAQGEPVAVEVFAGNTGDPATFQEQVGKVRERFGVGEVVWVGDRGMITKAQIEHLQALGGQRWITALRAKAIQELAEAKVIQMSLFDTQHLAEIQHPDYPGERLVACYNPLMAEERKRKREELVAATERELEKVAQMVARGASGGRSGPVGTAAIAERVGRVINKYKMAKHFATTVEERDFRYERKQASIEAEARLDGVYVLRTNVGQERLDGAGVVLAYKSLSRVERGFRHLKLSDLQVRPVYHYREKRVRAHLLLCMLAYKLQRALEKAWAPLLFVDEAPSERKDPVAPAERSMQTRQKDQRKQTVDGLPLHSFRTLLADLGTIVKNRVAPRGADDRAAFDLVTVPTKLQARAFDLLGITLSAM